MHRAWRAALCALVALVVAAPATADDKVSGQTYVRHDGGTDAGIAHCNNTSSSSTPVAATATDVDPNDGGSRRQGNEPYSVVDPTNPLHIYAGWNDYCLTDLGAGWQGFAYSTGTRISEASRSANPLAWVPPPESTMRLTSVTCGAWERK